MASPKPPQILSERPSWSFSPDESMEMSAMQHEMKLRPTVFSTRLPQEAAEQPLGSELKPGPGLDRAPSGTASTASTASTPRVPPKENLNSRARARLELARGPLSNLGPDCLAPKEAFPRARGRRSPLHRPEEKAEEAPAEEPFWLEPDEVEPISPGLVMRKGKPNMREVEPKPKRRGRAVPMPADVARRARDAASLQDAPARPKSYLAGLIPPWRPSWSRPSSSSADLPDLAKAIRSLREIRC